MKMKCSKTNSRFFLKSYLLNKKTLLADLHLHHLQPLPQLEGFLFGLVVAVAVGGAVAPGVRPAELFANVVPLGSGTVPAHTPLAISLFAHVRVKGAAPWRRARLAEVAGAKGWVGKPSAVGPIGAFLALPHLVADPEPPHQGRGQSQVVIHFRCCILLPNSSLTPNHTSPSNPRTIVNKPIIPNYTRFIKLFRRSCKTTDTAGAVVTHLPVGDAPAAAVTAKRRRRRSPPGL